MNPPEAGNVETVIRRRPTRRHRRNRRIRRALLIVLLATAALGSAFIALEQLSPSLFRASGSHSTAPAPQAAAFNPSSLAPPQQESVRAMEDRPVYPYSVVSGGVKDAGELKRAADHDPVVRAHYAGFDYDHARVVRLVLARTAYISYRIGNKVYWTRHRVSLKKGETVITDGKITARTRCANRVEEVPQQASSSSEPPVAKFDEPVQPATGTAVVSPPVPFQSALLNRNPVPGLGPTPPLSLYDPFTPGNFIPIAPPPLPSVCGPVKKKGTTVVGTGKKKKIESCGSGGGSGGEVPEPSTWLLVASGLALMFWMSRRGFGRT